MSAALVSTAVTRSGPGRVEGRQGKLDGSPSGKFAAVDLAVGPKCLASVTHSLSCRPGFSSGKHKGIDVINALSGINSECSGLAGFTVTSVHLQNTGIEFNCTALNAS